MNTEAYAFIENNEDSHWWFCARRNIIRMLLKQQRTYYDTVLDVGCGSGHFLWSMKDMSNTRYGIDEHSYRTADHTVMQGDARDLPFEDNSMDLITMLDVLEHIPDSDTALKELHRVVKQDGVCLLTVPAFQCLYSPHDRKNHHVKRYSKNDLCRQLERNGFRVLRCSYFNTWLFPIEAAVRLLEKVLGREIAPSAGGGGGGKKIYNIFKI